MKRKISKKDAEIIADLGKLSKSLVWYTPLQIERGDHLIDTEQKKGERPWSISPATGKYLYDFIIKHDIRSILELGTSVGFSALWMSLGLSNKKKNEKLSEKRTKNPKIVSFERNPVKIKIAKQYLKKAGTEKVVKILQGEIICQLRSLVEKEMIKKLSRRPVRNFDLLFFDADRSNYDKYLNIIGPLITPNTYLIVDNAIDMKERLKTFVEKLKNDEWNVKTIEVGDGLLVCRKSNLI
jgi:predicted O-methyltransferase YrrM